MLHAAQFTVGRSSGLADSTGQQPGLLSPDQQRYVAHVVGQRSMHCGLRKHQELHCKFGVNHSARAVLDIEQPAFHRPCRTDFFTHRHNLTFQQIRVARCSNDAGPNSLELLAHWLGAQHKAGARHGLVLPGPSRIATAPLLVIGVGGEAGDQQTRVAVRAQRGVNLKQIALAGFNGQPVDELAHQSCVHLGGLLMVVLVYKNNVQVAAVAQFFAAELSIGNDCQLGLVTVAVSQALPAPIHRNAERGFR